MLHSSITKKFVSKNEQMSWACSQDSKATVELPRQQQKGMSWVTQTKCDIH